MPGALYSFERMLLLGPPLFSPPVLLLLPPSLHSFKNTASVALGSEGALSVLPPAPPGVLISVGSQRKERLFQHKGRHDGGVGVYRLRRLRPGRQLLGAIGSGF